MIAPITIYEGAGSLEQILDFWTCPLLAAKWADSIMRRFTVTATPMDILLPGAAGPRLAQMGLAVFHLSHMMDKAIPRMLEPCQPIVEVAGARSAAVDAPTEFLPKMVAALHAPLFRGALIRQPQHSVLSTLGCQRVSLRVVFASGTTEMDAILMLQSFRSLSFGALVYYGLHEAVGAADSLILEFGHGLNFRHYWPLCRQAILLSPTRAVVQSVAEAATWSSTMTAVMERDADDTLAKLKHKASVRGGRTVATPAATAAALAATRRGGNRRVTGADCTALVTIRGDVGHEDAAVAHHLMTHLVTTTGLELRPAANVESPSLGEFFSLAAVDPLARPGTVKILLPDLDSVRKVYTALDGQSVRVGNDVLGVRVANDVLDAGTAPGGAQRRR